jgi:hypothetical protein
MFVPLRVVVPLLW